jgi:hypothetical protein
MPFGQTTFTLASHSVPANALNSSMENNTLQQVQQYTAVSSDYR